MYKDWKGLPNVHVLFCLHKENKRNLCCQFDDTIEVDFLLGINIWGLRSGWVNMDVLIPIHFCP